MQAPTVLTPPSLTGPLRLEAFTPLGLRPEEIGEARATGRALARATPRWAQTAALPPGLFLHEYTAGQVTVRGLVGALDLTRTAGPGDRRTVFPHEAVLTRRADSLADRMDEIGLQPAPLLLVQHSPGVVRALLTELRTSREPDLSFFDLAGTGHRVWSIADPAQVADLQDLLAPTTALIADGHHRYAASLRLHRRRPGAATASGLAMVVDHDDSPLFLGAIHRTLTDVALDDLEAVATSLGLAGHHLTREDALARLGPDAFVATDGERWLLTRRQDTDASARPPVVELLHRLLLPALPRGPRTIAYHHTLEEAVDAVAALDATDDGRDARDRVAVLLPSLGLDQVLAVAGEDRLLPEKATSFQPKPATGVLMRSLRDD